MASLPMVLVAGLGRCGSSLTMQMLAAGGLSCVGEHPDYEVADLNHQPITPAFIRRNAGRAAKWLDPHHAPLPTGAQPVVIWLDRDPDEQTDSQVKFAAAFFNIPVSRAHRKAWRAGLLRDRMRAQQAFDHCPRLIARFEALISDPPTAAEVIAAWLVENGFPLLNRDAMARVVIPRGPECQRGLDIEMALVEGRPT